MKKKKIWKFGFNFLCFGFMVWEMRRGYFKIETECWLIDMNCLNPSNFSFIFDDVDFCCCLAYIKLEAFN